MDEKASGEVADATIEGAIDAIDDVLGLTPDEPGDGSDTGGAGSDGESEPGAGEGDADEGAEGDGDEEGAAEGDEEAPAESEFNEDGTRKERNPDGTFKKPDPAAKPKDPLNDPLPKDLKKETSERMQSLIKIAKEVTAERDRVASENETLVNGIRSTGASPDQYGETLSWLSLFNSPQREAKVKAYELVRDVAERMATMLGVEHSVSDPLANHPDLKDAVAKNQTTLQFAREIARNRESAKFNGQIQQNQQQQQQTQAQATAEHAQAKKDLNAFEAQMKVSDPLYDIKRTQLVPMMKPIFARIPKSQWASAWKDAYTNLKVQPRAKVGAAPLKKPNQPLRANKNPAGGQGRAAGSALEAMNAALNGMAK